MGVFQRRYSNGQVSKDWYIDNRARRKRYKCRIYPNKKLAEQVLHHSELTLVRGEHLEIHETHKIHFADFAAKYLQFARSTKTASTYAGNVIEMQRLIRAFDGYLSKLTTAAVEHYKLQHRQEMAPATVNRELPLLKNMLTKAVECGWLKSSPATSVKLLKEPSGQLRYLEAEDI